MAGAEAIAAATAGERRGFPAYSSAMTQPTASRSSACASWMNWCRRHVEECAGGSVREGLLEGGDAEQSGEENGEEAVDKEGDATGMKSPFFAAFCPETSSPNKSLSAPTPSVT